MTKLSARERLANAKAALAAIEAEIAATTEARKRTLLIDDDDRVAAVLDRKLARLRLAAQRARDKIEWLPERIVAEESEAAWPSRPDAIKALIDKLARRLSALQGKRPVDRSADDDATIDHLKQRVPALRQRLEQAIKMEATP
jgi:hypothetical protein